MIMTATIKITAAALLSPQIIDTKMPIYAQNLSFFGVIGEKWEHIWENGQSGFPSTVS